MLRWSQGPYGQALSRFVRKCMAFASRRWHNMGAGKAGAYEMPRANGNVPMSVELVRALRIKAAIVNLMGDEQTGELLNMAADAIEQLEIRRLQMRSDAVSLINHVEFERNAHYLLEGSLLEIVSRCEARTPPTVSELKEIAMQGLGGMK